ncbi:hypothetical protein [Altererythrobacter sp. MTPC7]|uniref:hypothetical protein n=1 Tax=Altererythrobacter sp. MTPC7 TaxID=3056567 RepID=UPI0036F3FAD8
MELPIVGSWVTLNDEPSISFEGSFIALNWLFPEALGSVAAGRLVGEIIETGIPELDERVIKTIRKSGERAAGFTQWDIGIPDYIELASDSIRLGSSPD